MTTREHKPIKVPIPCHVFTISWIIPVIRKIIVFIRSLLIPSTRKSRMFNIRFNNNFMNDTILRPVVFKNVKIFPINIGIPLNIESSIK